MKLQQNCISILSSTRLLILFTLASFYTSSQGDVFSVTLIRFLCTGFSATAMVHWSQNVGQIWSTYFQIIKRILALETARVDSWAWEAVAEREPFGLPGKSNFLCKLGPFWIGMNSGRGPPKVVGPSHCRNVHRVSLPLLWKDKEMSKNMMKPTVNFKPPPPRHANL